MSTAAYAGAVLSRSTASRSAQRWRYFVGTAVCPCLNKRHCNAVHAKQTGRGKQTALSGSHFPTEATLEQDDRGDRESNHRLRYRFAIFIIFEMLDAIVGSGLAGYPGKAVTHDSLEVRKWDWFAEHAHILGQATAIFDFGRIQRGDHDDLKITVIVRRL